MTWFPHQSFFQRHDNIMIIKEKHLIKCFDTELFFMNWHHHQSSLSMAKHSQSINSSLFSFKYFCYTKNNFLFKWAFLRLCYIKGLLLTIIVILHSHGTAMQQLYSMWIKFSKEKWNSGMGALCALGFSSAVYLLFKHGQVYS